MSPIASSQDHAIDLNSKSAPSSPAPKSLSRRIAGGTAWSLIGRFGSVGCLFAGNVILARTLPTDDYSSFLAALSLTPFLATLVTMGTPYTVVRALRLGESSGRTLRSALIVTALCAVVVGPSLFAVVPFFPDEPKWRILREAPFLVASWAILSAICIVCGSFLQGLDDFRSASLVGARSGGLVPNLAALSAISIAALIGTMSVKQAITYQLLGHLAALALAAVVIPIAIRKKLNNCGVNNSSIVEKPRSSTKWMFHESWPNLINQLIAIALVELDLFWVTCLADETTVVEYGVVRNLRILIMAPLMVGTIALAPFVTELHSNGDLRRLERLLRGTATLFALPSLLALAAVLLFPQQLIRLTFGAEFESVAGALQIASIGAIFFVLSGSNGLTLTMTGRHRDLLLCGVAGLVVYLAVSPWLVSKYQATGAAAAFSIQSAIVNCLATFQVYRVVGVWTVPHWKCQAIRFEAKELAGRLTLRR
jgi:O-antigen/teichoic acid export membrane protein